MINVVNKKQLHVSNEGTAGPYIRVPVSQLDELCELLDKHRVGYSVEEEVISLNRGPETAIVDLDLKADIVAVQANLDSAQ